jgi:hypothetical protein
MASHLEMGEIPNIWKFGQKMVFEAVNTNYKRV